MRAKLKRIFAAAAVLIVAGATVAVGLFDANQAEPVPLTCKQWRKLVKPMVDHSQWRSFYIAIEDQYAIPEAVGNRLIGVCGGGECIAYPTGCPYPAGLKYRIGQAVNGWRLVEARGDPYFGGSLKMLGASTSQVKWLGGSKRAFTRCLNFLTGPQCQQLFRVNKSCWRLGDDTVPIMKCDPDWVSPDVDCAEPPCDEWPCAKVCPPRTPCAKIQVGTRQVERTCRYGKLYGFGMGGDDPCPYNEIVAKMDCTTSRGAGSALRDAAREWTDEDLDL